MVQGFIALSQKSVKTFNTELRQLRQQISELSSCRVLARELHVTNFLIPTSGIQIVGIFFAVKSPGFLLRAAAPQKIFTYIDA